MSGSAFRFARLGDLTEETEFWTPRQSASEAIRYIDVSAISSENLSIRAVNEIPAAVAPSRARKMVRANDTLFATIRPGLRRIAQVPQSLDGAVASTAFCVLRPRPELIDPDFLFFAVSADTFVQRVQAQQTGASYPAVRDSDVLDQEIPLPVPHEQKSIAGALDSVRASIRRAETALANSTELKQAALRQLFTCGARGHALRDTEIGPLPESWDVIKLGDLGRVGNGSTPRKDSTDYWHGGTFPWLNSAKVYDREVLSTDQFVTDVALRECHLPRLQPGAVLIAITGQGKTLGHCAVLRIEATINQHIAYVAVDQQRADSSFVRGFLETRYDYLRQAASGGGSTKGALTCAFLRDLQIPLPKTLQEQQEIVAILDAIDKKVDLHKRKRAVLEQLFQALLHKLMTGEIRVTDLDLSALSAHQAAGA